MRFGNQKSILLLTQMRERKKKSDKKEDILKLYDQKYCGIKRNYNNNRNRFIRDVNNNIIIIISISLTHLDRKSILWIFYKSRRWSKRNKTVWRLKATSTSWTCRNTSKPTRAVWTGKRYRWHTVRTTWRSDVVPREICNSNNKQKITIYC